MNVASRNFADAPYMSAGNGMWSASAGLVQAATSFDAISGIGGQMDMVGGALVNGLLSGGGRQRRDEPDGHPSRTHRRCGDRPIHRPRRRGHDPPSVRARDHDRTAAGHVRAVREDDRNEPGGETYSPAPLTPPGWFVKVTNESIAKYTDSVADGITGAVNGIGSIATPRAERKRQTFSTAPATTVSSGRSCRRWARSSRPWTAAG